MPGRILSLRPFRALCFVAAVLVSVQACGGRSDTEDYLYGDDVPSAGSGGSPGAGASSSTGGKKPGKAGASGTGASAPGGGNQGVGGSISSAGSGVTTGGVGATAGIGQGGFAQGGTGVFIPVSCGAETCNAVTQVCCATLGGFGCLPEGQECTGATLLCSTTDDCTDDQVCCLRLIGEANATAQCKDACEAGMGAQRERRLCTSDAECSNNRPFCRDTTFGVRVCTRF
jgi:hypothetical protein